MRSPSEPQASPTGAPCRPDGHCFSFDSRGNGYVRCEGAGIIVLKSLRAAQAAGDRIYAVIRGCGVNHDGAKPAITNPRGEMRRSCWSVCVV